LVGIALSDRRERHRWLRDSQLQASTNLLSALQPLVRRMINVAYLDRAESQDPSSPAVAAFNDAMVAWNNARCAALLVTPSRVAAQVPALEARSIACWTWPAIRRGRGWTCGSRARSSAAWLRTACWSPASWPAWRTSLPSIWTWDVDRDPAPPPPRSQP
jgi:hypothetical protein